MTSEQQEALREVRALLATCQARSGANADTTLALLVRAVERLTDAIAGDRADAEEPTNTAVVAETTADAETRFDRSRPPRRYNRGA